MYTYKTVNIYTRGLNTIDSIVTPMMIRSYKRTVLIFRVAN